MDYKVFRMAILTIISAFALVLVIVYATNADRINELLGRGKGDAAANDAASFMSSDGPFYGDQIGENLDGFLTDDSFFDETEKVPSIVVIKEKENQDDADAAGSSSASEDAGKDDGDNKPKTEKVVVGELTNPNVDETDFYDYANPSSDGTGTLPPIEGTPVGNASSN